MKDTLRNIEETGEFVVSIISSWMAEAANHCSGLFPFEVDEFDVSGLTPIPSTVVVPPRVQESAFHMECKVIRIEKLYNDKGEFSSSVVIGRVVMFHVVEPLLEKSPRGNYQVKFKGFQPMGRLNGDTWCHVGPQFDIPRPNVAK
jgi:flavin reductase (DIM6/NTAB) family NADH-FMN oxidoreductase RutF